MILIDTNILLYAVNSDDPRSTQAAHALESIINGGAAWALSWCVVYEFLRVCTHPRIFRNPLDLQSAWAFVSELMRQRGCILIGETAQHAEIAARCLMEAPRMQGNHLHDYRIAVLMREHGIKTILTEDRDFRMFPWIEIRGLSGV